MGVSACATCDGFFYRGKIVAVVGGGDTACEEALYLASLCRKVYMVVRRDVFRASKAMQERIAATDNIEVLWNSNTQEVLGDDMGVTGMRLRKDGVVYEKAIDGFSWPLVIIPIPIFSKSGSPLMKMAILLQTDVPLRLMFLRFAAGDVQDPNYRQAITAAASGCKAALDAEKFILENK